MKIKSYYLLFAVKKTANSVTYLKYNSAAIRPRDNKLSVRSTWTEYLCGTSIDWARYDASEQNRHQQDARHLHCSAVQKVRSSVDEFEPTEAEARAEHIPLSAFQQRLWSIHNILEDPSALNLTITCFVRGKLQFPILQLALSELARRNQILRIAYSDGPNGAEQKVHDTFNGLVRYEDASEAESQEAAVNSCIERTSHIPLDIKNGEVMRITQLTLGEAQYAIVLVIHHIAIDNGSTISTLNQLIALYDALLSSDDLDLVVAPRVSYIDFALWSQRRLQSGLLAADLKW